MKQYAQLLRSYLLFFALIILNTPLSAQLYINEIMASNATSLADELGQFDDWIEIYNASDSDINLAGYYLTDDILAPFASPFPTTNAAETTVPAGGFLIVWADKDTEQGAHHLDFKLSSAGETIYFYSPNQVLLEELTFTEQNPDVAFGRVTDGSADFQYFYSPTPGFSNATIPPPSTFEVLFNTRVNSIDNDVEQHFNGNMIFGSGDLELGFDGTTEQLVGVRFEEIALPPGTVITEAYLQFTVDEISLGACDLTIYGELNSNAAPYLDIDDNVTERTKTTSNTTWSVEDWILEEQSDLDQRSPDLSNVLNEILEQGGWQENNALSFIISGTGSRVASAYNSNPEFAPKLEIKAQFPTPSTPILPLFINEIAANSSAYMDESGKQEDWIELYNPNDEPIFIGGLYLSDDPTYPTKWQIGSPISIPAGGFQIIFADKDPEEGGLHTSFALDNDGETIVLSQVINNQTITIDEVTYGAIPFQATYGRLTDGSSEFVLFGQPTPDASNNGALFYLAPPTFSVLTGIYQANQSLSISHLLADVSIYYTNTGDLPSDSDALYSDVLSLSENQTVRALAYKEGYAPSAVINESYLFDFEAIVPVFHIITDPDNLFDDEIGIYVDGTNGTTGYCSSVPVNWAQDWERPANLKMFLPDGTKAFDVNAGIRIAGACSRGKAVKSLNIYTREDTYGDAKIDYPLFSVRNHTDYKRLKLRNSGQDFIRMGFRDLLNQSLLIEEVDLDLQAGFPVAVFINGEFWAMQNLRENFNGEYFEAVFGVKEADIDIIKSPGLPWRDVKEGNELAYTEFFNWLQSSDLSTDTDWNEFKNRVDWNEFTNYWISMTYLGNYDWPANNLAVWRERKEGEKWRYLVTDTDGSTNNHLGGSAEPEFNTLEVLMDTASVNWPNHKNSTLAFRKSLEHPEFHSEYVQRTCSFINLFYNPERVNYFVDSIKTLYDPYAEMHIAKWENSGDNVMGGSISNWEHWIDEYRLFFEQRPAFFRDFMESVLDLNGAYELTVDFDENSGGYVLINRNQMDIPFQFQGLYMRDVPVQLTAVANEGYAFSHWLETGETNPTIDFLAASNATITPVFVDECTPNSIDTDLDGICDLEDNCIETANADQADIDNDGIGDVCDDCDANLAGTPCNDGDFCTNNDTYDADCNCVGTFEDTDNDGICNFNDPCNNNLAGTPCNDNNACTINDTFNENCQCIGVFQDEDNDGICDANDDCNNNLEGTSCDDANACTIDDSIDSDCNCIGTFQDSDNDGICDAEDNCDNAIIGTSCDDNDSCTGNDIFNENCDCIGIFLDEDNDGICDAEDDCDNTTIGSPCNDGDVCTINDVVNENCECIGIFADNDNDGICNAEDECDDTLIGASCDDNDMCTSNDIFDETCNCAGVFQDIDEDGICDAEDECNGNLVGMPCDDNDACTIEDTFSENCECGGIFQDSDDDGICDVEDDCDNNLIGASCDDQDACTINDVFDEECICKGVFSDVDEDGICTAEDCDDTDPAFPQAYETPCDDGNELTFEDVIQEDGCTCMGTIVDAVNSTQKEAFEVSLYPNPATTILNIKVLETEVLGEGKISVYNAVGVLVIPKQNAFISDFSLDVKNLASGVYWLLIETSEGKIAVKPFVLQK